MKHRCRISVVCLAIAWIPFIAVSQQVAANPPTEDNTEADIDPALLRQLKELDQKLEKVEDMQARFTQVKHVSLLKDPLTSRGIVLVKGQRMRWESQQPIPTTTLTSAREIQIHYPQQKLLEVYQIDDRLSAVVASPLPRLPLLLRHFKMERLPKSKDAKEDDRLEIRLTPRGEELKKHVARVNVAIGLKRALAERIELTDVDGDRTVIDFDEIQLDVGLKDERFELKLPPGTRVVRPLESVEPKSP